MAKLSREQWKKHERACELVELDRQLTWNEREFILDHWNPMATNNVGAAGAFFTPAEWAEAMMLPLAPRGRLIDLCAGIGRLAYTAFRWGGEEITEIVCVEINPDFVRVGKRVLPEARWIEGNAYDQELVRSLGTFDKALSNPPFGKVPTVNGSGKWLSTHAQGADVMAVEIGAMLAGAGVYIIPADKTDYHAEKKEHQRDTRSIGRFLRRHYPEFNINPWAGDDCIMDDDGKPIVWVGAAPKVEVVTFSIRE